MKSKLLSPTNIFFIIFITYTSVAFHPDYFLHETLGPDPIMSFPLHILAFLNLLGGLFCF